MNEETEKKRIDIVMRQLYLAELEFSGTIGMPNFEENYAYALSRKRIHDRLYVQACRLLRALEQESNRKPAKRDLTIDELWKTIEDVSKP